MHRPKCGAIVAVGIKHLAHDRWPRGRADTEHRVDRAIDEAVVSQSEIPYGQISNKIDLGAEGETDEERSHRSSLGST